MPLSIAPPNVSNHPHPTGVSATHSNIATEPTKSKSPTDEKEIVTSASCLRYRQNTLALLFRLPNEILLQIVALVRVDSRSAKKHRKTDVWRRQLMGSCARIRSLMIGCPSLWTHIDLASDMRWIQTFIQHARSLPLTISLDLYRKKQIYVQEATQDNHGDPRFPLPKRVTRTFFSSPERGIHKQHEFLFLPRLNLALPRATRVDICLGGDAIPLAAELDCALKSEPLPHLRSFTYHLDRRSARYELSDPTIELAKHLQSAPQLTRLVLSGEPEWRLSVLGICLPALLYLELRGVEIVDAPEQMFDFIAGSPLLEDLHISIRYGLTQPQSSFNCLPIRLPHLRKLSFNFQRFSMALTLSHLRALPVPSDDLKIVTHPCLDRDQVQEAAVLYHIQCLLDVSRAPVTVSIRPGKLVESHVELEIIHPGTHTRSVAYHRHIPWEDVHAALAHVKQIEVSADQGSYPRNFFRLAAAAPLQHLASVTHVTLHGAGTPDDRASMLQWLRARAKAGRRVHTVDPRGNPQSRMGREEAKNLADLANEIRRRRLAHEFWVAKQYMDPEIFAPGGGEAPIPEPHS
jgi:hypothetical protein